jgi:integrase
MHSLSWGAKVLPHKHVCVRWFGPSCARFAEEGRNTALERAGWILAGRPSSMEGVEPSVCRFHDLRHSAITRMIVAKTPIPIIAQLVGWSPTTMWEMAKKYGHYEQEDLRAAINSIATAGGPP